MRGLCTVTETETALLANGTRAPAVAEQPSPSTRRTSRGCCGSSGPRFLLPHIRPANSSCSATRGTISTPTSAASSRRWVWLFAATAWQSALRCRSGNSSTSRPSRPSSSRRPARRLLPAPNLPRHRQHPDPRDGLGKWRGALVRQHPFFLPLHARPLCQFHPALAAAVRDGARADRPLSLERPGHGRRPTRATSPRSAPPTPPPAGGPIRRRVAYYWKFPAAKWSPRDCLCPTRHA